MALEPLWVSHTAMSDLAVCEQRYAYHYVDRLSPIERAVEPSIGTAVHDYDEYYYRAKRDTPEANSVEAHLAAMSYASLRNQPLIEEYKRAAWVVGKEDLAQQFDIVMPQFEYMAQRYFALRGRDDWDRYDVDFVEEPVRLKLVQGNRFTPSIWVTAKVDLGVTERATGRKLLWEHKNPKRVPDLTGYTSLLPTRLRDVQTVLYVALLYVKTMMEGNPWRADEILWNYMSQTPPSVPDLLKSGLDKQERVVVGKRVSRDKRISTTWPVYRQAVVNAGDDPDLYTDMYEVLKDAELNKFFVRIQVPQVVDVQYMVFNFINWAKRARDLRKLWAAGKATPQRVLNWSCNTCSYNRLCHTAITGGQVEDTIAEFYKKPEFQQQLPLDDAVPEPIADAA